MTLDSALTYRLKRLMLFRVVMITTLLLAAAYVEAVSETLLPVNPLYFLVAATYGLTILYVLALRFGPYLKAQVYVQVVLDLLTISGLVYLTGGAGSRAGFMLLYPISVLSGSVLLYRRMGLVLAGVATLLYAGTLLAVRMAWVPAQGLSDVPSLPAKHLFYSVFVTGVACATVALIGSYLSESLRHVGQRLEEATGQVADLTELNEVIVNSIHSGLLTANASGEILHLNRFGEGILGRPAAELRGQGVCEVFGSDLLDPPALRARRSLGRLVRFEIPYERPDGTHMDLGLSISPLAHAEPGREGHLLVFQDLTDIKRLEYEVRIKEKLAAVGEMAAYLAHEIRNPLGSISGSAQVLMSEPNISQEQERLLSIIRRESKRLSDSLDQFLNQARPAGKPPELVNIGPVVAEAVTLLRNGLEVGPRHAVEFLADDGYYLCRADPDQITQVFWNLARNGLEAMPDGGTLKVRLGRERDEVVIAIQDQGRGMAREEQRRLFEPFHSSTPRGTGLGLAIVYRIVREHRGDITVRSTPAHGTVVEVRLPLASMAVPA